MMRWIIILSFLVTGTLYAQNPISQIEGFLELHPSTDTTSLYLGRRAGQKIDTIRRLYNVFIGSRSGLENTSGKENVFIGTSAGQSNVSGDDNVFIGDEAGENNVDGRYNVFIGEDAGERNVDGNNNVFIGDETGGNNRSGRQNVFVGSLAGRSSRGSHNTLVGYGAGEEIDSTEHNTCLGTFAGDELEGNYNTYIGSNAGEEASEGDYNVVLGYEAGLENEGSSNCFIGSFAGHENEGNQNVFVGHSSGQKNTTGLSNSLLGYNAGLNNISGSFNSFFGSEAGLNNFSGSSNVFVGNGSGKANSNGGSQVYIGNGAGSSSKAGLHSVCLGTASGLFDTLITSSVYVGHNAGALSFSNQGSRSGNVFLGNFAGYDHKGSNKLFISNTSVDSTQALVYGEFNNNIFRVNADLHVAANATNGNSRILMKGIGGSLNEVIRYDGDQNDVVMGSVTGAGGKLYLRTDGVTQMSILENGNVGINTTNPTADLHVNGTVKVSSLPPLPTTSDLRFTSSGILARSTSDGRLKTDIQTLDGSLDKVLSLRGVSFLWKTDEEAGIQLGMIAQEVLEVVPEIVNQGEDGFYSVDYSETIGLLVEAIKEQQIIIDALNQENENLKTVSVVQDQRLGLLEKAMARLSLDIKSVGE